MSIRILAAVAALTASTLGASATAGAAVQAADGPTYAHGAAPLGALVIPATKPAGASKPGAAALAPIIPSDCTTTAVHVDNLNNVSLVSSGQARTTDNTLIDALIIRKLGASLGLTPSAVAPVSLRFPTASTVEIIMLAAHQRSGNLYRVVIKSTFATATQQWKSVVNTALMSTGGFGTVRSMAYKDTLLYVLRNENTFMRYQAGPGLVGLVNPKLLPRYDWNSTYKSISLATNVITGTGASRLHWHQMRGISKTGALMEARVARTSAASTGSYVLGPRGWGIYSSLYTGGCTKNPTTMMMMGVLSDGRLELWKHTWADRLTGGLLEKKLVFTPNLTSGGRFFG